MTKTLQLFASVVLFALLTVGCHTPQAVKQIQAKNPWAKNAAKTPTKIVDAWNSYAQTMPEGKVMRGLAGQVHFFDDPRNDRTVKVDGDLTVYVFDGNEKDPAHTKPLKIYQFKSKTLDEHHVHKKPWGHGYNFFLPIDEIGGEEKPLCVVVRFDDKLNGKFFVKDEPVNTLLAGRKPTPPTEPSIREFLESRSLLAEANRSITATQHPFDIQQVAFTSEENESKKQGVSTISLTGSMTRRLMESKEMIPVSTSEL